MIFQPFIGKQGWVVGKTINTNLHVHVLLKVNHGFPRSLKLVLMANFKLKVKKSLSQNWGARIFSKNLKRLHVVINLESKFMLIQD